MHHPCQEVTLAPPSPGRWVAPAYYRVDLTQYQPLPTRLNPEDLNKHPDYLARVRQELVPNRPPRYPFSSYGPLIRVTQGQYLTRCTAHLYQVLQDALGVERTALDGPSLPATTTTTRRPTEYQEGQRKLREAYFFTRNPRLAAEAKRLHHYTCEVCGFNFEQHYGALGQDFAECHHKNPLAERPEELWAQGLTTSLDEVAVVCANCHRMLHRQRPALSVEALRAQWLATY
ncbi:HNH endonuclease [Hymenobacter ginkgonis]|uniref:HNH endonuclease n=1 Tax=Hymenobacter ginkgonis TaxID=2682976 RepID=UPI0018DD4FA0|nr:HNH endonuclease [Hymenobacter ginkgonis]